MLAVITRVVSLALPSDRGIGPSAREVDGSRGSHTELYALGQTGGEIEGGFEYRQFKRAPADGCR
jgi:hypothetical protein